MSVGEVITGRGNSGTGSVAMLVMQALHGFVVGTPVYWNGTIWVKAIADSNSQVNGTLCTNVVKEVKSANSFTVVIGKDDIIQTAFTGLTPNSAVYLSASTAGAVTSTEPALISQYLGWHQANGLIHYGWQFEENLAMSSPSTYSVQTIVTANYTAVISVSLFDYRIKITTKPHTGASNWVIDAVPAGLANFFEFEAMRISTLANPSLVNETTSGVFSQTIAFNKLILEGSSELFALVGVYKGDIQDLDLSVRGNKSAGVSSTWNQSAGSYGSAGRVKVGAGDGAVVMTYNCNESTDKEHIILIKGDLI
jgi:hypothetical protein